MRKNLKAAIIVAGVLSAFYMPAGIANEISNFADLQGAITSGGTHNVNANIDMTDAITNTGTNSLTGTAADTTIDITNNGSTSAITNQGELTINNINFTGGENAEAYVINNLTGGTVNFQGDIKFENNGGFEYNAIANAVGGVIKSDESSNLTFTTNQAGIVPVIDNYGELNLAGKNTFSENSSMAGAIGNSHTGTANIGKDAVFNNNEGEMGGAIYNQGEFTVQEGAEFSTNISTMGGGAIYNSKSNDNGVTTVPDMNVDSATFTGNYVETSATQTGGSTSGDMGSGFATGGAIYNNQAQVTVSNSTFDGNQAISHFDSDNPSSAGIGGQAQGGAIYSVDGTVTINGGENAVFKNNAATSDGTGRKNTQGGAIYGKNSTINLDSTTGNIVFESSNSADLGKDLYLDGTTVANINGTNSDYYVEFTGDNSIRGSIESEILKSGDGGLKLSNGDFSTYEGQFTQTGGKTELNDATLFANSDIQGGQLSLNGASNISSTGNFKANNSTIAFADNSNTSSILGAMSANDNVKNNDLVISNDASQPTLTVDTDISVGTDETGNSLTINDNVNYSGDITVTDGTVNANAENADLTISGALSNNGTLNINSSAGQKVIQSGSVTGTGTISKTGEGDYTVTSDGSGFSGQFTQSAGSTIFDGAGSKTYQNITINDGGLTITNGAQAQTGNITINNSSSQFTVSGSGTVIEDTVNLALGGVTNVSAGAEINLNTGDSLSGVFTNDGGVVNINNFTNKTGSYTQNTGETTVTGNFAINNDADSITGGKLNIGTDAKTGTVNQSAGTISAGAEVDITANGTLNISGGSTSLNTGDKWEGTVNLSGGSLSVSDITNGGKLDATGGNLTLDSTGTLNIGTGSQITNAVNADLSGKVNIDGGSVSLNTGDTWAGDTTLTSGSLTVNNITNSGKLDATGGNLTLGSTGTLNIGTGSQITDAVNANLSGKVNIDGGSVSLNTGDTWSGDTTLTSGSLIVNNISNSGKLDATGGNLTLGSTGTLNIGTGSQITDAVNANLSGKVNIDGGSVSVNTGDNWSGDTTLSSGSLTVSDNTNGGKLNATAGNLTLDPTGTLNIGAGSAIAGAVKAEINGNVDITNGGSVTLNQGDTLGGTIALGDGGIFTVDGIALDASGGKVTQTGGALNINNGAKFTTDSSLTGGTVTVNSSSELELSNTGNIDITSTISSADGTSKITQSGSGTTTYANDVSSFVGQYVQKDGVAEFSNAFFGGNSTLENGTINLNEGSSMVNSAVLALGNTASVNISVADGDNKNFNNFTDIVGMTSPSGAVINAGGDGTMILSGDNSGYTGQFIYNGKILEVAENTRLFGTDSITDIQSGEMNINNYVSTSEGSTLKIASGANVNINNSTGIFDLKSDLEGDGDINKNQDGDLIFSGDHSQFNGNTNINSSGNITFVNGMFGNLNFNDVEGKTIGIIADNIQGAINQTKNATVSYTTINYIDLIFNNEVNVSAGTFNAIAKDGRDVYFKDDVEVTGGTMGVYGKNANFENLAYVENASLYSFAQATRFNELGIDKGNLIIANNGFEVANTLVSTGTIDVMNGVIANNTVGGDFYTIGGETSNFKIDISPRNKTSDSTTIDGSILNYGTLQGTINISDFQFIGKAPIDRNIGLTLFKTSNPIDDNVLFTATNKEIFTPIGYYRLFSMGGGDFNAKLVRYNPQVFRGQVATVANYANQLAINNVLFDHVNLVSQRLLRESSASPNKYAAILPEFAPYQYTRETGGLWVKAYGNFEKIGMTQGLNVGNNAYGTLIGADLPVVDLKNGWSFLPTAYIGYNGAHQTFDHVGMYQNGGQGGFMGTFMKNDFIGSVLAYAGGYANEMNVAGFTDTNGNWFAGTAAKAAYNFHPSKNFIIQPTLLASYNYFGRQTWHTDFGDMGMRTGMLNGINIAPGINFIYGRETWSIYATIQYMYNIMGYVGGKAGNVDLEGIKMRHGYIEYGLGVTKTWKERLDGYLQITFRNGGRTGVGFQGGLTFRF